jgi:hypothetical protein
MEVVVTRSIRGKTDDPDEKYAYFWEGVVSEIEAANVTFVREPVTADVTIVLGGKWENPAILHGKKVLVFTPAEWMMGKLAPPKGWKLIEPVLEAYYDEFISIIGESPKRAAKKVLAYIESAHS